MAVESDVMWETVMVAGTVAEKDSRLALQKVAWWVARLEYL